MAATPGLRLEGVVRDYGKGVRIGPVTCGAGAGEFVSLLGPSGCGKTTLLRCIAGFEPVDAGALLIDGVEVSRLAAHKRGVGLVFQHYALFPHLTVADNVAFGLRLRKVALPERRERIAEALRMVGLEPLGNRLPAQLSGGQQQRVAIARSLVLRPSIMLLDEPLSNLDFKLRIQMRAELRALQRRLGMTFVFVTHDQTEALALSDRIIVLSHGRIEQDGTPAEIYRTPRTRFVADFIGASNLLEVTRFEPAGEGEAVAQLAIGGQVRAVLPAHLGGEGPHWISVRPESLRLAIPGDSGDAAPANRFTGRLVALTFAGDRSEATIALDGASPDSPASRLIFYVDPQMRVPERVTVVADPSQTVLIGDR